MAEVRGPTPCGLPPVFPSPLPSPYLGWFLGSVHVYLGWASVSWTERDGRARPEALLVHVLARPEDPRPRAPTPAPGAGGGGGGPAGAGKNTGVDCHCLLQRIFLTQGANLCLLHCGWILYHLATWDPYLYLLGHFILLKKSCVSVHQQ